MRVAAAGRACLGSPMRRADRCPRAARSAPREPGGRGSSRMIASAVTRLAAAALADQGQGPARPRPEGDAVDRGHGAAVGGRRSTPRGPAPRGPVRTALAARAASITARSNTAGMVAPGRKRRKMHVALLRHAHAAGATRPAGRHGRRPAGRDPGRGRRLATCERRRLLAALVAAGRFAGLQRGEQALSAIGSRRCLGRRRRSPSTTCGPASMLPATEKSSQATWPHQSMHCAPGMPGQRPGGGRSRGVGGASRPASAATSAASAPAGACPSRQPGEAGEAVQRIDQRLRRHGADAARARGQRAPTAKKRLATATPSSPVCGSRARMDQVMAREPAMPGRGARGGRGRNRPRGRPALSGGGVARPCAAAPGPAAGRRPAGRRSRR